jgi:pimeloyl-ACP methyl ester carboxylesterase
MKTDQETLQNTTGDDAAVHAGRNGIATGSSAPRAFPSDYFDYQFAKFLGLAPYSGAEIGECFATAHQIADGNTESWTKAWQATASRVEALAKTVLARGHRVSAREAFLRATTYYQAAFYFLPADDARKRELYDRHRACFAAAGDLFDSPFETVRIPYEGRTLPGYFLRCDNSGKRRATVLIQMGGDGTAEQLYFSGGGAAALRRSYNVLLFEGPGQSGAYMLDNSLVYRYDWEAPIGAIIDYLLTRKEVDAEKIVLIAYSMGGYFGPRAVAFEKRIAACIADSLLPDMYPTVIAAMGMGKLMVPGASAAAVEQLTHQQRYVIEEGMPRFGIRNGLAGIAQFAEALKKMNLAGLEEKITCPLLNISSTAEGTAMCGNARAFFDKLSNPKNRFVMTTEEEGAEMHCQKGNASLLHQIEFDWLDEVLAE